MHVFGYCNYILQNLANELRFVKLIAIQSATLTKILKIVLMLFMYDILYIYLHMNSMNVEQQLSPPGSSHVCLPGHFHP